jgi:hypothetical protein
VIWGYNVINNYFIGGLHSFFLFSKVITGKTEYVFPKTHVPRPASSIQASISPFTLWGRARETLVADLTAPEMPPSAPSNLRLFTLPRSASSFVFGHEQYPSSTFTSHGESTSNNAVFSLVLRWDEPEEANGVLRGYRVWQRNSSRPDAPRTRIGRRTNETELFFEFFAGDEDEGGTSKEVYYFEVEASNSVGGTFSKAVEVTKEDLLTGGGNRVKELPLLVAAAEDTVEVREMRIYSILVIGIIIVLKIIKNNYIS